MWAQAKPLHKVDVGERKHWVILKQESRCQWMLVRGSDELLRCIFQ